MSFRRWAASMACVALLAISAACGGAGDEAPEATSTPKPVPSPVAFAQEPAANYTRGDPAFEALPGATAHFGTLGGSVYEIEMPDQWSGRLVLFMHGSRLFEPELFVEPPAIRRSLIRNGIAWGASSFSSNVPGDSVLAANETAALWDLFAQQFGRPTYTYVTGHSMGGIASVLSAERYANRYDGALPLCGAGVSNSFLDFFVAGAFVAGVGQQEFDSTPTGDLLNGRIRPALEDAAAYERFQDIVIDLTGGPRAFDREGIDAEINFRDFWTASQLVVDTRIATNEDMTYELGPLSDVSSEEFNASVVRVSAGDLYQQFTAGQQATGELGIPVLALSTTGDIRVPLAAARDLQRSVDAAGKSDLLIQRVVRDPYHCGFSNAEWEQGLEDLIAWVEDGRKPGGDDVLSDDPAELGGAFTLYPRIGSPEADGVPGAEQRITVSGTLRLDGSPIERGYAGAVVRRGDGPSRNCTLDTQPIRNGRFDVSVAADAEAAGCGRPGAQLFVFVDLGEQGYASEQLTDWPDTGNDLAFDAAFSSANPSGVSRQGTTFVGEVLDAEGNRPPPGTVIEAFVGDALCGVTSIPYVRTAGMDPSSYALVVVPAEVTPGCTAGATISFRIDGEPAAQTAVNDLGFHELDLTLD